MTTIEKYWKEKDEVLKERKREKRKRKRREIEEEGEGRDGEHVNENENDVSQLLFPYKLYISQY